LKSLIVIRQLSFRFSLTFFFKDILFYTKVKYHAYPASLAISIIQAGLKENLIKNEIFLQLIKQSSSNLSYILLICYSSSTHDDVRHSGPLVLKLLYLCLWNFRPTSKEVEDALLHHLSVIGSSYISKFTTFDVMEDMGVRCYELLTKTDLGFRMPSSQEASAFFVSFGRTFSFCSKLILQDLASEKVSIFVTIEESTDGSAGKGTTIEFRVPTIPAMIKPFLVYEEGVIRVEDLTVSITHQLKLPFIGKLALQNAPEELKLPEDGILPEDLPLLDMLERIRVAGKTKRVEWFLLAGDPKDEEFEDLGPLASKFKIKDMSEMVDADVLASIPELPTASTQGTAKKGGEKFDPEAEKREKLKELEKLERARELRLKQNLEEKKAAYEREKEEKAKGSKEKLEKAKELKLRAQQMKLKAQEAAAAATEDGEDLKLSGTMKSSQGTVSRHATRLKSQKLTTGLRETKKSVKSTRTVDLKEEDE
jgi:hypothetical protein